METEKIDLSTPEYQTVLQLIEYTSQSVFLTGKAGTGKSTLLKYIKKNVKKRSIVLAPTGIAAINVGGTTLHSFFKLPFHPLLPDDSQYSPKRLKGTLKYNPDKRKLINSLELIIIDEVSMVRADIIDFIDKILRIYTGNRIPFGGKQMLFVGDIFQLEPVIKADEKEMLSKYYTNCFFFSASVFNQIELVSIELTKVYRQSDRVFVNILNHIRNNSVSETEFQLLNTRVGADFELNNKQHNGLFVTLATRKDTVDTINANKLACLNSKTYTFSGDIEGDFPLSSLPTPIELELKVGAQVIFIKNDLEKQWVNGTLGIIEDIDDKSGRISVIKENGSKVFVTRDLWRNIKYSFNEKEQIIEEQEIGSYRQYPLRLAWAITVHKSQGLTFEQVEVDFSGGVFAAGQAYVALSRCTSLGGIRLKRDVRPSDVYVRPEIISFSETFNNQRTIDNALMAAKADITYKKVAQDFDNGNYLDMMVSLGQALDFRNEMDNPLFLRLASSKLGIIRKLKRENERLQREMDKVREKLAELSKEYLKMGDMCLNEMQKPEAALQNFHKAIDLCPSSIKAHIGRARSLIMMKEYDRAINSLDFVIKKEDGNAEARLLRGYAHIENGNDNKAITDLLVAARKNKKDPQPHELLADIFERQGEEEAKELHQAIAEEIRKKKSKGR